MSEYAKLLVSACPLDSPVRYDGSAKPLHSNMLDQWRRDGGVVAVCPELLAGFATPRPPAEIAEAHDGLPVLEGEARIAETGGADVTSQFIEGAIAALNVAFARGCRFALLTDKNPSCGGTFVYDGSFTGRRNAGEGVAAALFRRHGIVVFAPNQIDEFAAVMEA